VAGAAVRLVVAAVARLRVVLGLYRVDIYKVAAMALGLKVPSKVFFVKYRAVSAALMAIKAPGLVMALITVISGFACKDAVSSHKVGIMIGRNPFALVAGITLLDRHRSVILMRHLLCIRLLLEIHQGASQKRNYENNLFH
jgi:hypothetical protein